MGTENRVGAAVRRLVDQGVLTEAQLGAVAAAIEEDRAESRPPLGRVLAETAAYAGAGLLLGGVGLVVASSWEDLARVGRVCLLAVVSVLLVVAGLWSAGGRGALFRRGEGPRTARVRLACALFALTSVSVTGMVGVALDNSSGSGNGLVLAFLAGLAVAVLGYAAVPSVLGLLACSIFSPIAVLALIDEWTDASDTWLSIGVLAVGIAWFALTRAGVIAETWAGYLAALVISVIAAQTLDFDHDHWAYVVTALIAIACFALYATHRSLVLVIGGGLALALAVTEAVARWTDNNLAAAVTVVVLGAIVLAVAAYLLTREKSTD
ncbi:DUF2157 domain-containing protein [Nocardia sp. NPDC052566]|uniref:DUF2157 domain-containing protein n=1 Tax=Nocardia sp. NPDC052566 TaxID=3364330 RepID=UPI0037CB72D6